MSNKRIFYASQSIHLQPVSTGTNGNFRDLTNFQTYGSGLKWIVPRGLQSAGISTTFNSTPVSQLGTLQIYSQTETVPQVEVTLNKVLDGTAPLYSICTAKANNTDTLSTTNKNLSEITDNMVNVRFAVFSDTNSYATGVANYTYCRNMYLSRVNYSFPVEGSATEEVTLVGSSKTWGTSTITVPSNQNDLTTDDNATPQGSGSDFVARRQYIALTGISVGSGGSYTYPTRDANGKITNPGSLAIASILPTGTNGNTKGAIPLNTASATSGYDSTTIPALQNISISLDLGRENINELGYFGPYFKYTTFPIEVTSEFQVISTSGDLVNADSFDQNTGCSASYANVEDQEIAIKVCGPNSSSDNLIIDLGKKNKLTSVNYTGGDTGGGNATVTYSFQTFNKFNVMVSGSYANYKYFDSSTIGTQTLS